MGRLSLFSARLARQANLATFAVLISALALLPPSANAQLSPPPCQGQDILADLKQSEPGAYEKIMARASTTLNGGALFWKIEKPGLPTSWLFGTIHMTDERVHALPDGVRNAIATAQTIVLEATGLSPESVGQAMAGLGPQLLFTDGRTLDQFLTKEEYAIAETILAKNGFSGPIGQRLKPWLLTVFLSLPECELRRAAAGLKSLDASIEATAKKRGANLVGLETAEEQLRAMAGLPLDAQLAWLKTSIRLRDRAEDSLETMIQLYLGRRIGAVWALTRQLAGSGPETETAINGFQQALITYRNERMRDRALPILEHGSAFIAVGALHLPGEVGLVQLFRDAGYRVTAAE